MTGERRRSRLDDEDWIGGLLLMDLESLVFRAEDRESWRLGAALICR
jgi:hypothetical protein